MAAAHHSQKYHQALVLRGEEAWLKQSPSARRKQAPLFKPSRPVMPTGLAPHLC